MQGIYSIVDPNFSGRRTPLELAESLLRGGVRIVQLRAKHMEKFKVLNWASQICVLKKQYPFTFIVNDFVDIACEVKADGVHVGAHDIPISEARKRGGPKMLLGYSSHSLEEAYAAQKLGADYVAFGAIFPSKTKGPGHPVQGLKKLREVVRRLQIPVVAIGGINRTNFRSVLETGVASIAMISALAEATDVVSETRYFMRSYHRTIVPSCEL